jgi:hypothetical protein
VSDKRENTIALAWHDTICPEAEQCRDRLLHSLSEPAYTSGVLSTFLTKVIERMDE